MAVPELLNLEPLTVRVEETAAATVAFAANLDLELAQARANAEAQMTKGVTDPELKARILETAKESLDAGTKELRAAKVAAATHLEKMLKEAEDKAARADAGMSAARSPRSYLEILGSADPAFAGRLAELSTAGPATLEARLQMARLTSDVVTIAAIARLIDNLPKDSKPLNTLQIAEETVGPSHRAMAALAQRCRYSAAAARAARDAAVLGRPITATEKIRLSSMAPRPQANLEPMAGDHPLAHVSQGLSARAAR